MLEIIGLLLIIAGWIFQLVHVKKKGNELCPKFINLYILGASLLAVDAFMNGLGIITLLNLGTLAIAGIVLWKMNCCFKRKKSTTKTVSKVRSVRKRKTVKRKPNKKR